MRQRTKSFFCIYDFRLILTPLAVIQHVFGEDDPRRTNRRILFTYYDVHIFGLRIARFSTKISGSSK